MSISENKSATGNPNPRTKKKGLAASETDELQKLETAFERIRKNIPETPYYLTIPQDYPAYRYWSSQDERSWLIGDLFDPSEQHLQYMSFIYRPHEDSIWVCRSEVDDERDRKEMLRAQGLVTEPTAPAANQRTGPRKKITLGQYKKGKETGSLRNSTSPEPEVAAKATKAKERPNGVTSRQAQRQEAEESGTQAAQKRSTNDLASASKTEPRSQPRSVPPAKKQRLSPPPAKEPFPDSKEDDKSTAHDLPPLLSPIHLPNPYDLPALLSPTLPPLVQAELEKRGKEPRSRAVSNASAKSDSRSTASTNHSPAIKAQKVITSLDGTSEKKSEAKKAGSTKQGTSDLLEVPTETRRQKLVVRLRYGRKNRREIERLLKLPPSRKDSASNAERPKILSSARKLDSATKVKSTATKELAHRRTPSINEEKIRSSTDKRPRADDDSGAPAAKKRKPSVEPENIKRPHTPAQQVSPAPSARNSAQKSQYLTPREPRTVNMIRNGSDQGHGATPEPTAATPSSHSQSASVPSVSSRKAREAHAFIMLSKRLNGVGRTMKHEAENIARSGRDIETRRHAAVVSVECLL